jgi:hypothetical protein
MFVRCVANLWERSFASPRAQTEIHAGLILNVTSLLGKMILHRLLFQQGGCKWRLTKMHRL